MDKNEERIKQFLLDHRVNAEHLTFTQSCHSVDDAARAVKTTKDNFVKNVCLVDSNGTLIVAIVKGEDRVSIPLVEGVVQKGKLRIATPEEVKEKSGYLIGGVPSFGYHALFLIDERVMEKEKVYSGGGSVQSLIKITSQELLRVNGGRVVAIRQEKN